MFKEAAHSTPLKSHRRSCPKFKKLGETVAVWEDGSMWADVPSPTKGRARGRKRICWLSGTDAFMGAAHLNNKNAPIIILVLFLLN